VIEVGALKLSESVCCFEKREEILPQIIPERTERQIINTMILLVFIYMF
jgi:hypothetical protein